MILEFLQDLQDAASVLALAVFDGEGNITEKWSRQEIKDTVFREVVVDLWQVFQIHQYSEAKIEDVIIGHKNGQIIARRFSHFIVLVLCNANADVPAISVILTAGLINAEKSKAFKRLQKAAVPTQNFLEAERMDDVEAEFFNRFKIKAK
ncbi:MAG: hypothetical protein Kow0037_01380 [Calditrichia bacterium]